LITSTPISKPNLHLNTMITAREWINHIYSWTRIAGWRRTRALPIQIRMFNSNCLQDKQL